MRKIVLIAIITSILSLVIDSDLQVNAANSNQLKLNRKSITLNIGKKSTIRVKTKAKVKAKVKWKSNNKKVAVVTNGVVKAKKVGKAKITAYKGKQKAVCKIKVISNVSTKLPVPPQTNKPILNQTPILPAPTAEVPVNSSTNDFEPGVVLVVLNKQYLGSTPLELFPELNIVKIDDEYKRWYDECKDLPHVSEDTKENLRKQIGIYFIIRLTQETKESVLKAIKILADNLYVKSANPNYISEPQPNKLNKTEEVNYVETSTPVPAQPRQSPEASQTSVLPVPMPEPPGDSLANDFEPGVVLVVLNKQYLGSTPSELFPELNIVKIDDEYKRWYDECKDLPHVSEDTKENLRKQIGTYFIIRLTQETKESVLEAIEILVKNPYVKSAEYNYINYPIKNMLINSYVTFHRPQQSYEE